MKKITEEQKADLNPMAKAFMDFCEKELNVTFIDAEVEEECQEEANTETRE